MAHKKPINVPPYTVNSITGWDSAKLVFTTDEGRDVQIDIRSPYYLRLMRENLDKIETYWRKNLLGG